MLSLRDVGPRNGSRSVRRSSRRSAPAAWARCFKRPRREAGPRRRDQGPARANLASGSPTPSRASSVRPGRSQRCPDPNILAILRSWTCRARLQFAVMELLDGRDAPASASRRGPLPAKRAMDYGAPDRADGLARGPCQGDRPSRLETREPLRHDCDGHVKILDFGLARQVSPAAERQRGRRRRRVEPTEARRGAGHRRATWRRNRCRGASVDHRTDVFGLGCRPATRRSRAARIRARDRGGDDDRHPPRGPSTALGCGPTKTAVPGGPRARHSTTASRSSPTIRFQSARDLSFALRSLLAASTVNARAPTPRQHPGRRLGSARGDPRRRIALGGMRLFLAGRFAVGRVLVRPPDCAGAAASGSSRSPISSRRRRPRHRCQPGRQDRRLCASSRTARIAALTCSASESRTPSVG